MGVFADKETGAQSVWPGECEGSDVCMLLFSLALSDVLPICQFHCTVLVTLEVEHFRWRSSEMEHEVSV